MITYCVSMVNGIRVNNKNIEVTLHDPKNKYLAFNQELTPRTINSKGDNVRISVPCSITITISKSDCKLDKSEVQPIDGDGNFTLIKQLGPLKYQYAQSIRFIGVFRQCLILNSTVL